MLCTLGVEIHNTNALALLGDHGARVDGARRRAWFSDELIDLAIGRAPRGFRLYDVLGQQTHDLSEDNVHFTPGSAAINILDGETGAIRRPSTADYVQHAKLVSRLPAIAAQSTALSADVRKPSRWCSGLSLLFGEKPVVPVPYDRLVFGEEGNASGRSGI